MKRVHSIELEHFKAFKEKQSIELGGKNLLLYGPNGSGKSSIFWALYTFLQSSKKTTEEIRKYFDPSHAESLTNIAMLKDATASIVLGIGEETDKTSASSFCISLDTHETQEADWKKTNRASDFVTYRVLFRFFHFANSEEIDLWPVFVNEILPFCSATLTGNLGDAWDDVFSNNPYVEVQDSEARGGAARTIYNNYDKRLFDIRLGLESTLDSVQKSAQEFYDQHFAQAGDDSLKLTLRLIRPPSYDRKKHTLAVPKIGLKIILDKTEIARPQSFLNEAKLTQIALSIRFGATKVNLQDAPMKLLVLDDLLISLDMSNRMQVIKVILADEDFSEYQKIILTHDKGFHKEIRRQIGSEHHEWTFAQLSQVDGNAPEVREELDTLAKAERLVLSGDYEEAGLQLRKSAEETLRSFLGNYPDTGKFKTLGQSLSQARTNLERTNLSKLRRFLDESNLDITMLEAIVPLSMDDILGDTSLSDEQKNLCRRSRAALRSLLQELRADRHQALQVLDQVAQTKDRILNLSAHDTDEPLYEGEMNDALVLLRELRELLCK